MQSGLGTAGIVAVPIPPDGAPGEVLTKLTATSYDTYWATGGSGPGGGGADAAFAGAALMYLCDPDNDDGPPMPGERGPAGAAGSPGVQGDAGPALFFLNDDEADLPPPLPGLKGDTGTAGTAGATGPAGPALFFLSEDQDDPSVIPGPPGSIGATGRQGDALFFLQDEAEDHISIPGPQGGAGAQGTQGTQGVAGPALFLLQEDQDDPMLIPGPTGAQGIQGPAGPSGGGGGGTVQIVFADGEEVEMPLMPQSGFAVLDGQNSFWGRQFIAQDIPATVGSRPRQLHITGGPNGSICGIHINSQVAFLGANHTRAGIDRTFATFAMVVWSDDELVQRNGLSIDQVENNDVAITSMRYGNPTDYPRHQFYGGIQQSYLFGGTPARVSTVATEFSLSFVKRMQMLSTNRLAMAGTSRLRIGN